MLGPITPAKLVTDSNQGKKMPPKPSKPNAPKQGQLFGTPPKNPSKKPSPNMNSVSGNTGVASGPVISNVAQMPKAGIRTTATAGLKPPAPPKPAPPSLNSISNTTPSPRKGSVTSAVAGKPQPIVSSQNAGNSQGQAFQGTAGLNPSQSLSNPLGNSPPPTSKPMASALQGTSPGAISNVQKGVTKAQSSLPAVGTPERQALADAMNQARNQGSHSAQVQGTTASGQQHYGTFSHNGKNYYFKSPNQTATPPNAAPAPSLQDKLKGLKNTPDKPSFLGDVGKSLGRGYNSVANFISNQANAWKNRGEKLAVGGRNLGREGTSQANNAYALNYDPNKGLMGNAVSGAKNWLKGTGKQLKGAFNEFQGRTGMHFEKEGNVIRFSRNGESIELYTEDAPKRREDGSYDNSGY